MLAASVPYGLDFARGYGPEIDGVAHLPDPAPGVAVIIIGWVVFTLAIIATWAYLLWCPEKHLRTSRVGR